MFGFHIPLTEEPTNATPQETAGSEVNFRQRLKENMEEERRIEEGRRAYLKAEENQNKREIEKRKANAQAIELGYTSNANRREKNKLARIIGYPNNLTLRNTNARRFGYKNYKNRQIANRYAQLQGFADNFQRNRFMMTEYANVEDVAFEFLTQILEKPKLAQEARNELFKFQQRAKVWQHYPTLELATAKARQKQNDRSPSPSPPSSPIENAFIHKKSSSNNAYDSYPEQSLTREQLQDLEVTYRTTHLPYYASGEKGILTRLMTALVVGLDKIIYSTAIDLLTKKQKTIDRDTLWAQLNNLVDEAITQAGKRY